MSSIIIYHHLGLGDNIICNGIVREYCKKYNKVAILSLAQNYPSVSFMYRDLPNIKILQKDTGFAKNFIPSDFSNFDKSGCDEIKVIGFQYLNAKSDLTFEEQFYSIAGVELNKKWDSFYVQRDFEREKAFYEKKAPKEKYIFLHDDAKRNYKIEINKIDKKYKIFRPDEKLTENIFDYCKIIEKAEEIHVIDSVFMFLIDCLQYDSPGQKLYVHRYARENNAWQLPILRKNWQILTLNNSWGRKNKQISDLLDRLESLFLSHPLFKRITRKIYRTMGWRTRRQKRGSRESLV